MKKIYQAKLPLAVRSLLLGCISLSTEALLAQPPLDVNSDIQCQKQANALAIFMMYSAETLNESTPEGKGFRAACDSECPSYCAPLDSQKIPQEKLALLKSCREGKRDACEKLIGKPLSSFEGRESSPVCSIAGGPLCYEHWLSRNREYPDGPALASLRIACRTGVETACSEVKKFEQMIATGSRGERKKDSAPGRRPKLQDTSQSDGVSCNLISKLGLCVSFNGSAFASGSGEKDATKACEKFQVKLQKSGGCPTEGVIGRCDFFRGSIRAEALYYYKGTAKDGKPFHRDGGSRDCYREKGIYHTRGPGQWIKF